MFAMYKPTFMKEKIKALLKTTYASKGLSEKTLEGMAVFLATSITEESQIEAGVKGIEPIISVFQSEIDTRVSGAVAKTKEEIAKESGGTEPKPTEVIKTDGAVKTPVEIMLETLLKNQTDLQARLDAQDQGNVAVNRKTALETGLKDAHALYKAPIMENFGLMSFPDDASFNEWLTKQTGEGLTTFNKVMGENGIKTITKPEGGANGGADGTKSDFQEMLAKGVAQQLAERAAASEPAK